MNDGKLEGLLIEDSLRYTDGKELGSAEDIKLGLSGGKVLGAILGDVSVITLTIGVRSKLGSLGESFDSSNYGTLEGLFLGYSLGYTDGNTLALYL